MPASSNHVPVKEEKTGGESQETTRGGYALPAGEREACLRPDEKKENTRNQKGEFVKGNETPVFQETFARSRHTTRCQNFLI